MSECGSMHCAAPAEWHAVNGCCGEWIDLCGMCRIRARRLMRAFEARDGAFECQGCGCLISTAEVTWSHLS